MPSELSRDTWVGLAVGDRLAGKYRVTRIIGRGAMGVVAEALDDADGSRVAIKALRPIPEGQAEATARFLFEAKAAAQMKSVHVARVLDVATLDNGSPYLVTEYLEGHDLAAAIRAESVLPVETAVDYVLQTCLALAEAHSGGIFHGDLKPSNIFLTPTSGETSLVKVLDFGVSKQAPPGADGELWIMKTRAVTGTRLYLAPEQMHATRRIDHHADIWSLGIVLHEALTGQMPFAGASVEEVSATMSSREPARCRTQRPDLPAEIRGGDPPLPREDPGGALRERGRARERPVAVRASQRATHREAHREGACAGDERHRTAPPLQELRPLLPTVRTPWIPTMPTLLTEPGGSDGPPSDISARVTAIPPAPAPASAAVAASKPRVGPPPLPPVTTPLPAPVATVEAKAPTGTAGRLSPPPAEPPAGTVTTPNLAGASRRRSFGAAPRGTRRHAPLGRHRGGRRRGHRGRRRPPRHEVRSNAAGRHQHGPCR